MGLQLISFQFLLLQRSYFFCYRGLERTRKTLQLLKKLEKHSKLDPEQRSLHIKTAFCGFFAAFLLLFFKNVIPQVELNLLVTSVTIGCQQFLVVVFFSSAFETFAGAQI